MSGPYMFDTSALLAQYQKEPGYEIVERLMEERPVFISAITWLEFHVSLKTLILDAEARAETLALYSELLDEALPVTRQVAHIAFDLREQLSQRLPNGDALIAATARKKGATLVHRDPHLSAIPEQLVKQLVLPPKNKGEVA